MNRAHEIERCRREQIEYRRDLLDPTMPTVGRIGAALGLADYFAEELILEALPLNFQFEIWTPERKDCINGKLMVESSLGWSVRGVVSMTTHEWFHFAEKLVAAGVVIVQAEAPPVQTIVANRIGK